MSKNIERYFLFTVTNGYIFIDTKDGFPSIKQILSGFGGKNTALLNVFEFKTKEDYEQAKT